MLIRSKLGDPVHLFPPVHFFRSAFRDPKSAIQSVSISKLPALRSLCFLVLMLSETSAVSLQPSAFKILQDEWVMLAPLGDHPHALGIQRFTPVAIQNMANRFNGLLGKLGRLFSGAPTFEGHHDVEPDKYPNSKSYGWIMSLDPRADGLWGRMVWTPEGRQMLQNGAFKFVSPVFIGKPIGHQNGQTIFDPVAFKSLALTNEPNLPLPPLANNKDHMETITSLLELSNEASADQILGAVRILKNSVLSPQSSELKAALTLPPDATADQILEAARTLRAQNETLANQQAARDTEFATLQNSLSTQNSALSTVQSERDGHRTARIELILANAIEKGRITLAQRDEWKTKLEADLASAEAALANCAPALNTRSITRELGNEKSMNDNEATRRSALTAFISEQMANGLSYDDAWAKAKLDRADIFANMVRK